MLPTSARKLSATVQRLASKYLTLKGSIVLCALWSLFLCSACSSSSDSDAERLNTLAYASHYRSLDLVRQYADSVLQGHPTSEQRAEALNNLAFYHIGKMHYAEADSLLRCVYSTTDNHLELLIASVQQMRICQRRSANKEFYEHRQRAEQHLQRIYEEERTILRSNMAALTGSEGTDDASISAFSPHQQARLRYGESEYHLISSVYFYYVGKTADAIHELQQVDSLPYLKQDTAQYVAYLYDIGSGGIITHGSKEEIAHQELDLLMRCYTLSTECGYAFWEANAMQALSEHLSTIDATQMAEIVHDNASAIKFMNTEGVADSLLAGNLAQRALDVFTHYGDIYQQSAAWRTLAECYWHVHDYPGAVYSLDKALHSDTLVNQAPALLSSIHEQYSLAFSALNDKPQSDQHRNIYVDLQELTRQDRELEARADSLNQTITVSNVIIWTLIALIVVASLLLLLLVVQRTMAQHGRWKSRTSGTVQRWTNELTGELDTLKEQNEDLEEQRAITALELSRLQEDYAEHRARVHLINTLTPLIDRMLLEVRALETKQEPEPTRRERLNYILELTERINTTNNLLTRWITMKQGELRLRIESFPISDVLDIVSKSAATFRMKGITLNIQPSDDVVKADKVLTLFMVNTLCDNARKFTGQGGGVTVSVEERQGMVEISVADTGQGMTESQQAHLFDIKPITDTEQTSGHVAQEPTSHGFGLLNCKGIIEKYKKTNALFADCTIGVESEVGKGSRIFFTLPKGIRKALTMVCLMCLVPVMAVAETPSGGAADASSATISAQAEVTVDALADSVFACNVAGRYRDAIAFAQQCFTKVNDTRRQEGTAQQDTLLLVDKVSAVPTEITWLRDSVNAPYLAILHVRNEVAVAALALHEWDVYHFNNRVYVQLFKELSADNSLSEYCQQIKESETNRNIGITILIIILLAFIPGFYFLHYRHVITDARRRIDGLKQALQEEGDEAEKGRTELSRLAFERDRLYVQNNVMGNSLSTIKHETMYYPSRISALVEQELQSLEANTHVALDDTTLSDISETATYYRAIYDVLAGQAQYNCRHQLSPKVLNGILLRNLAKLANTRLSQLTAKDLDAGLCQYDVEISKADELRLLLCTQIARDLGEQYNLRRCGIVQEGNVLHVIVPVGIDN